MNEEIINTRKWIGENLTDITANNWFDPDLFALKILPTLPPVLELILPPPSYDKGRYNCFVYAFGLHNDDIFLRKTKRPTQEELERIILINSSQLLKLLSSLEKINKPSSGDYIFYKNGGTITHAGIYLGNNMVESKWSDGPIFRHPIHATNPGYGEEILFYKKISSEIIKDLLIAQRDNLREFRA